MFPLSRFGTLLALVAVLGLAPREASALTYTNVVNTPNEYSFGFFGRSDSVTVIVFPAVDPVGWLIQFEGVIAAESGWSWQASIQHLGVGAPPLTVLLNNIAYGQEASGSMTLPNGPGFDSLEMKFRADGNGSGGWGEFSGRFSAIRTGAAVPDAGSTVTLIGLALLGLVAVRRKLP
jgi:hypothetical protein